MDWTEEQEKAIYEKGNNILVAAAAGSGKTAVLVERIIQKIIKDKIDIDKLLVVTFTNAAAAEMRERVLEAIYKKLDELEKSKEDDDKTYNHLQRQITLLSKAHICTIDSFCLDVIRNNFFEIDISANFRISSEEENVLLKYEVLEDLFEELYENEDKSFERLVNIYTGYRGDDNLKELILNIYKYMQAMPFPNEWLFEKISDLKNADSNNDFGETKWGKIILNHIKAQTLNSIDTMKGIRNKLEKEYELEKYTSFIDGEIMTLQGLYDASCSSWDDVFSYSEKFEFGKWPTDKKIVSNLKEEAKSIRDDCTKPFRTKDSILRKYIYADSKSIFKDIDEMYEVISILGKVIIKFDERFAKKKREKNIFDFNDIEHFALKILIKRDENGNKVPSEVAKKYREKYEEVAIDEYQDSNEVQEYILRTISRDNNIFMVGDVKQSIYKFRRACPRLFLDKYRKYSIDGNEFGKKIQLFKNFRSRKNILDITNILFSQIMTSNLGDNIEYTEEEYLNFGGNYEDSESMLGKSEVDIIDLNEEYEEYEEIEQIKNIELEAKFVAKKIKEIIESKKQVYDKQGYRNVRYRDIVILLRTTSNISPIFENELLNNDIPVFSDSSSEYLDTIEIQTVLNVLKIIDNPLDDIAMASCLRSKIGDFTDNEILEIRILDKNVSFYDDLVIAKESNEKVENFLSLYDEWKRESDFLSLSELIWKICTDTGFYSYVGFMPNGNIRQANLKLLFEVAKDYEKTSLSGIFNFINFVERLKGQNSDLSQAKIIGENEDVVRIMSIHKSKGLEFPIVFLANSGKKFNYSDLNSNLLLHEDLGFGIEYIDYEKMIEYTTPLKDAVKILSKEEVMAEEMRLLYVAITRAKEKIIIVGTSKDFDKDIKEKDRDIELHKKTNLNLIKKYSTYLDWIELVFLNDGGKNIDIKRISKKELLDEKEEKQDLSCKLIDFGELEPDYIKRRDEDYSWIYPYKNEIYIPIKSTVTKIKEFSNRVDTSDIDFSKINENKVGIEKIEPIFIQNNEELSKVHQGSVMHLFLKYVDFKNGSDLIYLKEKLLKDNIISENEYKYIDIERVEYFLNSKLGIEIKNCKTIEKEKPFCVKLNSKDIFDDSKDEEILVQGIIDLYAIKDDDTVLLMDYKTDFIKPNEEDILIKRYRKQLEIYKIALEKALGKKVDEVYIYSLCLNKCIML